MRIQIRHSEVGEPRADDLDARRADEDDVSSGMATQVGEILHRVVVYFGTGSIEFECIDDAVKFADAISRRYGTP